ncbi:MAG: hypothetical protein ACPHEN_06685, partial [Candidatus Poseidoniaceae archaeon]
MFKVHIFEVEIYNMFVAAKGIIEQNGLFNNVSIGEALQNNPYVTLLQGITQGTGLAATIMLNSDKSF